MRLIRDQAGNHAIERLAAARDALQKLERVLAQGTDVEHTAKCVQMADELHSTE
jgi:hypothetical protein